MVFALVETSVWDILTLGWLGYSKNTKMGKKILETLLLLHSFGDLKSPRKTHFSTQCHHESGLAAWFLLPFCTKGMKSLSSSGLTDEIFFQRRDIFRKNFLGQKSLVRLTNFLSRQKSGLTLARAFKREQNHHTKEDGVRSRNTALQGWIECCRLHQRHACFYSWIDYKFKSYGII